MNTTDNRIAMDKVFLDEYTSHDAILKYTRATAGYGVSYLLDHDYKDIYCAAIALLPDESKRRGITILEYGCGGGMNLVHLLSVLKREGIKVTRAVGTDFSPVLISAAQNEARQYLPPGEHQQIEFYVARNETLDHDIAAATGSESARLAGTFDFIFGVNTNRYCHRFGRQLDCTRSIKHLLAPEGMTVAIDMNDRFPAFRSTLKNHFRATKEEECYIPSIAEYAVPYREAGFEVLRNQNFCWIPHSSGKFMCAVMHMLTPIMNVVARPRAMRSLVVARKPTTAGKGSA